MNHAIFALVLLMVTMQNRMGLPDFSTTLGVQTWCDSSLESLPSFSDLGEHFCWAEVRWRDVNLLPLKL